MIHWHHGVHAAAAAKLHVVWCALEHGIYVACSVAVCHELYMQNSLLRKLREICFHWQLLESLEFYIRVLRMKLLYLVGSKDCHTLIIKQNSAQYDEMYKVMLSVWTSRLSFVNVSMQMQWLNTSESNAALVCRFFVWKLRG